jgi:hypothetical protein
MRAKKNASIPLGPTAVLPICHASRALTILSASLLLHCFAGRPQSPSATVVLPIYDLFTSGRWLGLIEPYPPTPANGLSPISHLKFGDWWKVGSTPSFVCLESWTFGGLSLLPPPRRCAIKSEPTAPTGYNDDIYLVRPPRAGWLHQGPRRRRSRHANRSSRIFNCL